MLEYLSVQLILMTLRKDSYFPDLGIRLALLAAVIFAVYLTFLRVFIDQYGWFWPNYISFMTFPIALFAYKKIFKSKETITVPKNSKVLLATFLSALLLSGGDIALNSGISGGFASVITPIAGASPTLFLTLSSFIFKDPVTKQQKIGIGVTLLGILLLSLFSL